MLINKRLINYSHHKRMRVRSGSRYTRGILAPIRAPSVPLCCNSSTVFILNISLLKNLLVWSLLTRSPLIFNDFCSIIIVGRYKKKFPYFFSLLPAKIRRQITVEYIYERAWNITTRLHFIDQISIDHWLLSYFTKFRKCDQSFCQYRKKFNGFWSKAKDSCDMFCSSQSLSKWDSEQASLITVM